MKRSNSAYSEFPTDAVTAFGIAASTDNQPAATAAYERIKSYVAGVARTYCKKPHDLPRFEQEALITIERTARKFEAKRGKPVEHLTRVAIKNAMLDELERDKTLDRRVELFGLVPTVDNDNPLRHDVPSPADLLIESELRVHLVAEVDAWLKTRPPLEREFILMHFFDNLSQSEIARRLGVSRAAISKRQKSTFSRARIELAHLREFMSVN